MFLNEYMLIVTLHFLLCLYLLNKKLHYLIKGLLSIQIYCIWKTTNWFIS